jgi:hypothetical protein
MKEESQESGSALSENSSGGPPAIPEGATSDQFRQGEKNTNGQGAVSSKKLEANRQNAQKSTGPRTESGKAKAAANAYKHGFFAKRLFINTEYSAKDKPDYETVANGVFEHYQPVGYMEHLWAEKVATEALRFARLIDREQKLFHWASAFEHSDVNNLLRYQVAINRQFVQAIQELERCQANRKPEATPSDQPLPAATPVEECSELAGAPNGQTDEQLADSFPTATQPHDEEAQRSGSDAAPSVAATQPTIGSPQEMSSGRSQSADREQSNAGGLQKGPSVGTNPPRKSLADLVPDMLPNDAEI